MSVALGMPDLTIPATEMKDGQLGTIVGGLHDGLVVQFIGASAIGGSRLQPIGQVGGKGWCSPISSSFRVRLLKAGETITVLSN